MVLLPLTFLGGDLRTPLQVAIMKRNLKKDVGKAVADRLEALVDLDADTVKLFSPLGLFKLGYATH